MTRLRLTYRALGLAALLALAGCAMLKHSPDLSIETVNATADGLKSTAATAIRSGKLSSADGRFVLDLTDNLARALDVAQSAADADDLETARGRIALASSILDEIEDYLLAKGVKANGNE